MASNLVFIGRVWVMWRTKVRVTVGTQDEMNKFKAAYEKVTAESKRKGGPVKSYAFTVGRVDFELQAFSHRFPGSSTNLNTSAEAKSTIAT